MSREVRPLIELSAKEQRDYSLCRAILAVADSVQHGAPTNSLELEVGASLHAHLAAAYRDRSFPIELGTRRPAGSVLVLTDVVAARAALDTATATRGAELRFTGPGAFVEFLRNVAQVGRLGATMLPGLRDNVAVPRQTATITSAWVAESPGGDVAESSPSFDQAQLAAKELRSTVSISRKLIVQSQSSAAVEGVVARDMFGSAAVELDRVAINGSGAGNEPRGILNTSGIGSVVGGANGAQATYDHAVDLEHEVGIDNADVEAEPDGRSTLGYLTTPGIRRRLRKVPQIVGGTIPAWINGKVVDHPAAASTNVPSNLTKGTSVGVAHALVYGRWAELVFGEWNGVAELIVDPFSKKKRGEIEVTFTAVVDVVLRHAASFAAMVDALV